MNMKNYCILVGMALVLTAFQSIYAQSTNAPVSQSNVQQTVQQAPESQINCVNGVNSGDTAWMLVSTALVMLMTPGLALFYGGMVRRKNVLGTIMQSFIALGVITVQWVLIGYSLAFGPDIGHIIGSLKWLGLNGVGLAPDPDYAPTIPHQTYMMFQLMFAVITPCSDHWSFRRKV